MANLQAMAASDPEKLMIKGDKLPNGFRLAKNYEKAKAAFEKASKGQEMLSSYNCLYYGSIFNENNRPWDAAKHLESAAALAKELGSWSEVADFYRRASELYNECGRSQPASDALARGARVLEDNAPAEAIRLYTDACDILEEDGKEQMAFDLYRAATSLYVKLEKYADAATFLLRWGLAADKCNATHSQCKKIDAFLSSDQNRCASKLLSAYSDDDVEEIKRVAQSSTIKNLDHMIIRLARKLPAGDVSALRADAAKEQEEALDEDDLT
ncbi:unnamed protein product [Camellia sinensis]